MVTSIQKAHDLTVALVAATAKEQTAEEYVRLYGELYPTMKKLVVEDCEEHPQKAKFDFE